ncbi:MAG TPA: VWA domain-containing protein [Acidisarcina sp.]
MFLRLLSSATTARRFLLCFASAATLVLAVSLPVPCLHAQSNSREKESVPTFRADVQNVVVDVVVTDRAGNPCTGLRREDFVVREQGKQQQIASFEEHDGTADFSGFLRSGPLPPGVFTNQPTAPGADVVNVLLLDTLNTPLSSQSYVHQQATKYLKSLPPGTRMAIFTLSTQLRFVQGFTDDASKLAAALNDRHGAAAIEKSPLLVTPSESAVATEQVGQLGSGGGPRGLADFLSENTESQGMDRIRLTYEALEDLARYLGPITGRKNVIWFAGSFPVSITPEYKSFERNDNPHNMTNLLAVARVALYPVRAGGIPGDSMYDAETQMTGVTTAAGARGFQQSSLRGDSIERATFSAVADELADETGGKANYGTNNLTDAMSKAVNNGSHYYTITYSPTDRRTDGRYRSIKVNIPEGSYHLEYRRGYFADSAATSKLAARELATIDPLIRLMDPGLPDFTQVLFKVRVTQSDPQPPIQAGSTPPPVTKDGALPPTRPMDSIRYAADFAISLRDVRLGGGPDGKRSGSVALMLVAFDRKGKALNYTVHRNALELTPQGYVAMKDAGLQLHDEIDVPRGTTTIRVGVYDADSNRAGTIQIPLSQLHAVSAQTGERANF